MDGTMQGTLSNSKRQAMADVNVFLDFHRFHRYRKFTNERFAAHAQTLVRLLRIIHDNDLLRISERLSEIANEVEENECSESNPNGHHKRAAMEIRKRARGNAAEACPWFEVLPELVDRPVLRSLAKSLWDRNISKSDAWEVRLEELQADVWDENVKDSTVRASVCRLNEFFSENGIDLRLKVNFSNNPPVVACRLISVDERPSEVATSTLASCLTKGMEARKKEIDERRLAKHSAIEQKSQREKRNSNAPRRIEKVGSHEA
jgi:hypothetical protein